MKSNNLDDGYTSKQFLSKLLSKNYQNQQKTPSPFKIIPSIDSQDQSLKQKAYSPQQKIQKNIYFHRVGSTVMSTKNVQKQNIETVRQSIFTGYEKYNSQKLIQQNKCQKFKDQKHISSSTISSEVQLKNQDQIQQSNTKNKDLENQQSVIVQKTILFLKKFLKGKLINQQDFSMLDELQKKISNPFQFDNLLQQATQNRKAQQQIQKAKKKTQTNLNNKKQTNQRSKSFAIQIKNNLSTVIVRKCQSLFKKTENITKSNTKKKKIQYRSLLKRQIKSIKDVLDKNLTNMNKQAQKFQ